jgi:hypothetical protein
VWLPSYIVNVPPGAGTAGKSAAVAQQSVRPGPFLETPAAAGLFARISADIF